MTGRMGEKETEKNGKSNVRKKMFWLWGIGTYSEKL